MSYSDYAREYDQIIQWWSLGVITAEQARERIQSDLDFCYAADPARQERKDPGLDGGLASTLLSNEPVTTDAPKGPTAEELAERRHRELVKSLGEAGHVSPWYAVGMIPLGMDGVSVPALAEWRKHRDEFVTSEPGSEAEGSALASMLATVTLDNPPLASDVERHVNREHARELASAPWEVVYVVLMALYAAVALAGCAVGVAWVMGCVH